MKIQHKKYGTIEVRKRILKDDYKKLSLVIESDKKEIGYVTYKLKSSGRRTAWLQKIEVHKQYQSQKFGDLLIRLMENDLAQNGCNEIEGKFWPTNDHARPFYEKHGYEIVKDDYETFIYKRGLQKVEEAEMGQ